MKIREIFQNNPCYPVFGTENVQNGSDIAVFLDFVEKIAKSGIKILQFREKKLETRDFINLAVEVVKICHQNDCLCIIDDRIDVVLATNADGVHIGQSDMPYGFSRKLLGYDKIIGFSLDYRSDIEIANKLNVDYVAINGVFHSNTKNIDSHIWGVDGLKFAKEHSNHAVVAIGGINEENIEQISRLCDGFAVISDICNAEDPVQKINKLNNLFCV